MTPEDRSFHRRSRAENRVRFTVEIYKIVGKVLVYPVLRYQTPFLFISSRLSQLEKKKESHVEKKG